MPLIMPTRTLDYLLMGILAGIIAGIILVYIANISFQELARIAEIMRNSFKIG